MDKTRDSTNSKIWPDSTCAISVRRKGQILLVVESLVLSTTLNRRLNYGGVQKSNKRRNKTIKKKEELKIGVVKLRV